MSSTQRSAAAATTQLERRAQWATFAQVSKRWGLAGSRHQATTVPAEASQNHSAAVGPDGPVLRSMADDFRAAPWRRRLALVAVAGWLMYEWGPGNETVTPWILMRVIGHQRGLATIPITAAIGFCFTTCQQLTSGVTALSGFSMFERTAHAAWLRLRRRSGMVPQPWAARSARARCALTFGLGTSAVALVEIIATGHVGVRRHVGVVTRSAVLCGALVGGLGAFAAGLAQLGQRLPPLSHATGWTIRILGNPLLWLALLGVALAFATLRDHRLRKLKAATDHPAASTSPKRQEPQVAGPLRP